MLIVSTFNNINQLCKKKEMKKNQQKKCTNITLTIHTLACNNNNNILIFTI